MESLIVDVIIAVHTSTRPIARAVGSVVDQNKTALRVTVVAHNIDESVIEGNLGSYAAHPSVRLLHLEDAIPSPAGPLNLGLARSEAEFVAVMGSDDELEAGAIDAWVELQRASGAAVIIAAIRMSGGGLVGSPAARPGRTVRLDVVRDRLAYRSAPLGLISRARFGDLRFAEGLSSGEDLPYVTRLWFSGAPMAFARSSPAYLVHDDAVDRVTSAPRPVADDFAFLALIAADPVAVLAVAEREALVLKIVRTHLFDAVLNRVEVDWPHGERAALANAARTALEWAPRALRFLSVADHRALAAILNTHVPTAQLIQFIRARSHYRTLTALVTRNPLRMLHSQAPLRTLAAGLFVQRGR